MSATTPPPRENIPYPIPSSTITIDIILNESRPLLPSTVNTCLSGAITEARNHPQSSLVEGIFKYAAPAPSEIEVGIIGGIFVNELTWGDVVVVLRGLEKFYEERGKWVAVIWYLKDEGRGALGDGYLEPIAKGSAERVVEKYADGA
ncbi:MAG: hypothetical protein LQ338_004964 [Usnochroma carphineum]|nr:MAG: hypothetical protein LQ338_004964 [Usnochroma carphineum]